MSSEQIDQLAILTATTSPWQLLYQDDQLLVVNKPAMLLTVPGRHPANRDCLISRVQCEFPSAQVVHRLDYDTSGLVVLPLTKHALSEISKQFQARTVHKQYQAVVLGEVQPNQGQINLPIAADPARRPLYKICQAEGKASLTHYATIAVSSWKDTRQTATISRLLLTPVTGRSHQLRLHLQSIGHPILGDTLYGNDLYAIDLDGSNVDGLPASVSPAQMSERLCLHACQLEFQHPVSGAKLQFSCEPAF